MRRWHQDHRIAKREWKKHRAFHVQCNEGRSVGYSRGQVPPGTNPNQVDCACDEQIGRFRKKDAFDCGNARCGVCHQDKFPKRSLTRQEIISELSFREQLNE